MLDEKPTRSKKYRWTWQTSLRSYVGLLFAIPFSTIFTGIMALIILSLLYNQETYLIGFILLIVLSPFIAFFIFAIVYILLQPLFSYLQISQNSIKYRKGLTYALSCNWDDIESLGRHQGLARVYDVLYLKRVEPLKWAFFMTFLQRFKVNMRYYIPLTGFQGWPEGSLDEELRRYAPHIFKSTQLG